MALLHVNFFSRALGVASAVEVILPEVDQGIGVTASGEAALPKVLYLLHGYSDDQTIWQRRTSVERYAARHNLAIVMPAVNHSFYCNEVQGERYWDYVSDELPRIMHTFFRLSDKPEDTFVAGLSMGGYGAIRNGLKYAENFGCIAGLSAALVHDTWEHSDNSSPAFTFRRKYNEAIFGPYEKVKGSDKDPKALVMKLIEEKKEIPNIYLCCGTEDGLISRSRDLRDFLIENNVPVTYEEGPGKHDWVFWDTYIKKILAWLPLNEAQAGINSGNVK